MKKSNRLDADDEDNKFSVDDKVFATLDPLTRRVQVADQTALVTDTVGFVSKLPAQVVAAFRATPKRSECGRDCPCRGCRRRRGIL